jgi:hypothetical protein
VPDLDLLNRLSANDADLEIYNRYAYTIFQQPLPADTMPRFELASRDAYRAFVAPTNAILRDAGLKYVIFPRPLEEAEMAGMKLIDAMTSNKIFIYELEE